MTTKASNKTIPLGPYRPELYPLGTTKADGTHPTGILSCSQMRRFPEHTLGSGSEQRRRLETVRLL